MFFTENAAEMNPGLKICLLLGFAMLVSSGKLQKQWTDFLKHAFQNS